MRSYSEIDTIVKRSTKAKGFSWGVAEEIGKNIKQLAVCQQIFGNNGKENFFKDRSKRIFIKFQSINLFELLK